jgi:hypothetical protein
MEWNVDGKQTRKSAKTAAWEIAAKRARQVEQDHLDTEFGAAAKPGAPKTVADAIALFTDSKRGEDLSDNTLYKHFIKDVTLSHLTTWRARWTFESSPRQA